MRHLLLLIPFCCLFTSPTFGADYYWIGGSGNWSDISHWATTSGGGITHSQVPTADDDVYFDINSFTGPGQIVVINNENIFCHNMDWTGATGTPFFQGDASKVINVFAGLNFIADMSFDFDGQIHFRAASTDEPIETAGHPMGNSIFFEGDGGWILEDSIIVDSLIMLMDGHLNTNNHNLEARYMHVDIQNAGSLSLGNTKITLHGHNLYFNVGNDFIAYFPFDLTAINVPFSVDPGTSLIEFTSNDVETEFSATTPLQFNDIIFSNTSGNGAIVCTDQAVSFGTIQFNSNGRIDQEMSAQHLILSPGKNYRFLGAFTYNLNQITATGNCQATITIEGNIINGQGATFYSDGQAILLDYINLKSINATGSSTYTADNSVDLGDNSGWTIIPRTVQNLYWVGGSGNWNDPANWSLTSGGAGGACIPSGTDNVFFDVNSFTGPGETVLVDTENIYCRDMDWTGALFNPSFAGGFDPALHIFGSLTMIEAMFYQFGGLMFFESQEVGKTITTGNHLINKIEFIGNGGQWSLQDSLKSETFIVFNAGTLNTNDQYVESSEFNSVDLGLLRRLELTNSTWVIKHFPDAIKDLWYIDLGGQFELDAGHSTINFQGVGGNFEHFAPVPTTVEYNRVIFNNNVGWLDNLSLEVDCIIDSLQFNHGGYLFDDFTANTLILTPGYTYLIAVYTTQTIGNIVAPANCNELITIRSDDAGLFANFNVQNDHPDLQYLALRDLHNNGPGMLSAQNSIDLGNNIGWTITALGNRTLYWVGGSGNWGDPAHWSSSSGGTGGECVPTLRDDVIFDGNSFSGNGQFVEGAQYNGFYCRDIFWEDNLPNPQFLINRLYCYGSVRFAQDMDVQMPEWLYLSSDVAETYLSNGQHLDAVIIEGQGTFTLLDAFSTDRLTQVKGDFNTGGNTMTLGRWSVFNLNNPVNLNLEDSYITITDAADNLFFEYYTLDFRFGDATTINPGTSVIEMPNPNAGAILSGGVDFNNIIFSGTDGLINVCHEPGSSDLADPANINLLEIGGDAVVKGYHNIDSLILAPGKSYQFEADVTQIVNEYLQILGNNCNPIELLSTLPGIPATIFSTAATVVGDFIQMRDHIGTGGADFFAGTHSTDIDNSNQGWTFDSAPDYIDTGFFGPDVSICEGEVLTLDAYNYSPGEVYLWSEGSTTSSININQAGTYWAQVTFGNMCEVRDTINVSIIELAQADIGIDTSICEGDILTLDASSNFDDVIYTWQDGSNNPVFTLTDAGTYYVELDRQGCITIDSITVDLMAIPQVDLGADQMLCEGELLILEAGIGSSAIYEWQDGSIDSIYQVSQGGIYSVAVTVDGCTGMDEVEVSYNAYPVFELGVDTSLCEGATLVYDFTGLGDEYEWQDGTMSPQYMVTNAGEYILSISSEGCESTDTITVEVNAIPMVDLGADQMLCEGELLTLEAGIGSSAIYEWQDGNMDSIYQVSQGGIYSVAVTVDGCTGMDEVEVSYNAYPAFELGVDTSLCEGATLVYDFTGLGDEYEWQDGTMSPQYTVTNAGEYILSISSNGCESVDTIAVEINMIPMVDLGIDQMLCEGELLMLEASIGSSAIYEWQDGSMDSTYQVSQAGIYSVAVTVDGCTGMDEVEVFYNAYPVFDLGDDTNLCEGDVLGFDFTGIGNSYLWQDGNDNPVYTIDKEGIYWLSISNNNCISTDTIQVNIVTATTVDLGADQQICGGDALVLTPTLGEYDMLIWQDGSMDVQLLVVEEGWYWLEAVLGECVSRDSVFVDVEQAIELNLPENLVLCSGEEILLSPNVPDNGNITWQDGSTTSDYSIRDEGLYIAVIQYGACISSDSTFVVASSCGDISVYIPTAFSPNDDGRNDVFIPNFDPDYTIVEYKLDLFDRWGSHIFSTENPQEGWDGMIRGEKANVGYFVYMLEYTFEDQGSVFEQQKSGGVYLVR